MLKDFDTLPEDPSELRAVSKLLAAEVKSQALMIEKLKHQLAGHNRHRFGSKSESLDQLNLAFAEEEEIAEAAEKQAAPSPDSTDADKPARQHSRKPLPDHLDRHEEVLSPGDDCNRCGGSLKTLGEDVTEELEYVPGRFVVNRIVRPRMACSCCEAICQAPLPSRPIERGRPGPGLLAHVLVSKYADHLPLYRQSQIYAREGIDLDRSTMADWVGRSTALLEPLADAIGRVVRGGDALFADDTPVKMQAPGNKKTKIARVWTYVRDERPWAGQSHHVRGTSSPLIERASIQSAISQATGVGFMRMDIPALTVCLGPTKPARWPVWRTCAASSSICTQRRVPPSPRKPFAGSPNFMASRKRLVADNPKNASPCGRNWPNPYLMNWRLGFTHSSPKSQANHHWRRPSDMPWAACQRRVLTSITVAWKQITTQPNALSNPSPLAGKIGFLPVQNEAVKPWPLPTL